MCGSVEGVSVVSVVDPVKDPVLVVPMRKAVRAWIERWCFERARLSYQLLKGEDV